MAMGSCLSIVSLFRFYLRRCLIDAGLSSQKVLIDGGDTKIHFWGPAVPTSKPVLVLIHGFGPSGVWQWRPQISFFVREYDVYVPDLVFFGDSYTKTDGRSEMFQASCIVNFLDKLGIRRFSVVGTSYGGFVAYHMASLWPERVEKVVIASSAVNLHPKDNHDLLKRVNGAAIEDVLLPTSARRLRTMLDVSVYRKPYYVPDFILNDFVDTLFSENRNEKLELLKGAITGQDETFKISPLSQEVLIVWGEHDRVFLLEKAIELNKLLGEKARLEVIKHTSHVPQMERPFKFNKIVNNFLHGF